MKAMILSAGFGKRLRPLTENCPKPLLKLGKETLLSNTINFLQKAKIQKVVINVHYLGEQIINYLEEKKFDLDIAIINEKEKILDTGGGILNAINHFEDPFLVINPDTVWNLNYLNELQKMKDKINSNRKNKCTVLVVDKLKSFDKNFKGDFQLENNLITRKKKENLNYIYTGLQIIRPEVFSNINLKVFSINSIWDKLITNNELFGVESNINFKHVSTLNIYKNLNII
tara:strand:- start:1089 stop:1775 length:687 start_codon:yes stop_codon:yes gene_type:complete